MTTKALLELQEVTRSFAVRDGFFAPKKLLQAVRGVSLKLMPGDVLALVGESGCGKTTLAKMLLGIETTPASILFSTRCWRIFLSIPLWAVMKPVGTTMAALPACIPCAGEPVVLRVWMMCWRKSR